MATAFARDQWYVAAYATEVSRTFLARTILGEPIVFYRTAQDGRVVALADRCVHRRYPLSESRLDGDTIVCGYHGFTYDTSGTCVFVPGQQRIPRTARVASYPVVEVDSFVWVWIGDPELADETLIPRAPHMADPEFVTVSRHGAHRLRLRPAGRQPARPLARDLPARRLHRHRRGRRDADHHRGRRPGRDRSRRPAHDGRRVPAVLREVHRHRRPDHAAAGHRILRSVPVPAAQPDHAGRASRLRCSAPRSPTRSRRPRRARCTTSGPSRGTSPSRTPRSPSSCAISTTRW